MTLKIFERSLLGVKHELRALYVVDTERGYRLDVSDLDEFVHGLKSALRKERETIKELRAKYSVTDDGAEALTPFGEIPRARRGGPVPDVRGGQLPRRGTPHRGTER